MERLPEPEQMDHPDEATAYATADFSAVNAAFTLQLLELTGDRTASDAVDLGTGPADIPIRLLALRPAWRITAVDGSQAMLDLAQTAIASAGAVDRISLVKADAIDTRLPGGSFDVIFSNSLLHHVRDAIGLRKEIRRLARPGAIVFLRDLARPSDELAAKQIVCANASGEPELLQAQFYASLLSAYTAAEIRHQLHVAGMGYLSIELPTDRHLDVYGTMR